MHVCDRQVRTYRTMSEQLTEPEKVDLAAGTLKFGEAQNIAVERAAKATQPTVANATKSGSTSAFSISIFFYSFYIYLLATQNHYISELTRLNLH